MVSKDLSLIILGTMKLYQSNSDIVQEIHQEESLVEVMARVIHNNLPVFEGKGYDDWCVKMEAILGFQEVDDIVKKGFREPLKSDTEEMKKEYKENRRLDCKARMLLH